jgi:hypothetical protein
MTPMSEEKIREYQEKLRKLKAERDPEKAREITESLPHFDPDNPGNIAIMIGEKK